MPVDVEAILASLPPAPTMRDINDACVKHNIPSLAQGMIELPPPDLLKNCAKTAVDGAVHTYRQRVGEADYLDSIAELLHEHYGVPRPPAPATLRSNIFATLGVSGAIVGSLMSVRASGRPTRVALVEPFYTYHIFQIRATLGEDAVLVPVPLASTRPTEPEVPGAAGVIGTGPFWYDRKALIAALESGVDAVLLCNPANPSGAVFGEAVLKDIIALTGAAKRPPSASASSDAPLLIVDECYCDLVWDEGAFWSPSQLGAEIPPNVVVARGFSKVLGCQSWRVGYGFAAASLASKIVTAGDPLYICAPWTQHALGLYMKNHRDSFVEHARDLSGLMQRNLERLVPAFTKAFGWEYLRPVGSMYACFRHTAESDNAAVRAALAAGIGVCPGSIFYSPATLATFPCGSDGAVSTGLIRIHVGISEEKADEVLASLAASACC